jgi:hypothetical protein
MERRQRDHRRLRMTDGATRNCGKGTGRKIGAKSAT